MSFKTASRLAQGRAVRETVLHGNEAPVSPLTDDEYYQQTKLMVTKLERQIVMATKGSPERRALVDQKFKLSTELARLRPKPKHLTFAEHFMNAASARLGIITFEELKQEASKRATQARDAWRAGKR